MEREQGVAPSVPILSAPEEVFLAWLLWLPEGADVAAAARREIARIDQVDNPANPLLRLRALLAGVVEGSWRRSDALAMRYTITSRTGRRRE